MQLARTVTPATTKLHGEEPGFDVPPGKRLKIETSPGGEEILDAAVPAGKKWINVTICVSGDEVDA